MNRKLFPILMLAVSCQAAYGQNFFQKFQQQMEKSLQQQGQPQGNAVQGGANSSPGDGGFSQMCKTSLGGPYKEKKLNEGPEKIVSKYFKVTPDLDKLLLDGIDKQHKGSLVSLKFHNSDLKDVVVGNVALAFIANPSVNMLAQVVAYAESGDGYREQNGPSELAEAQTLLAMVIMQYPQLSANTGYVNTLLRAADNGGSGLGKAMLARTYLFGDYATQDINSFSGYIAGASQNYPVKIADQSIFYALENIPNWKPRNMYLNLLQGSVQMQQGFQRQQEAAKSADTNQRALKLMREGERIDQLTLEALGAGPKMAEIRAKGEMLRKEGSGEANLIQIEANQSDEYKAEVLRLISSGPKLNEDAKSRLAEANKLKMDNVTRLNTLTVEVALKFFSGNMGEMLNTGPMINRYVRNACTVANRQFELGRQTGLPTPQVDNTELAKSAGL